MNKKIHVTEKQKMRLAAFFLPILLFGIIMAIWGQFPFGDKTLMIWDMNWQYSSFFSHFHDILHGDASPWYAFSRAIGGDMIGVASYYLMSPFNLVFFFIGKEHIYLGILIVMLLKLGCMGLCMHLYLSHRKQAWSTLCFSTAYALSGFIIAYIANIMWFDGVILLPLMVLGIEKLVEERKYMLYLLTIGFGVITNFYTGYMLCFFSVLYFACYFFLLSQKKKSIKKGLQIIGIYAGSSLLGGAISAFIALPTVYAMAGGKGDLDLTVLGDFTQMFSYAEIVRKSFAGTLDGMQTTQGTALVYGSVLAFMFMLLYFFIWGESWKKKLAYGFLLVFLLFSMSHYNLNCAWQGMYYPNGAQYRFAFVYIFILLMVANEAYSTWQEKRDVKWNRYLPVAVGVVLLLVLVWAKGNFDLTGRKALWLVNVLLVVGYVLSLMVIKNKKNGTSIVVGILAVELCANACYQFYYSPQYESASVAEYNEYIDKTEYLVEKVKAELEDELFRTVLTGEAYRSVNDNYMWNLYGLDSYTSQERDSTQLIAFNLGYYRHMVFGIHYNEGSTRAAESLLGVKYMITSNEPEVGYTLVDTDEKLALYENQYALPVAIMTNPEIAMVNNEDYNVFEYQNEIYGNMDTAVSEAIFTPTALQVVSVENGVENPDGTFSVTDIEEDAWVVYQLDIKESGKQYLQSITSQSSQVIAVINGIEDSITDQSNVVKQIGYVTPEDEVYLRCKIAGENPVNLEKVFVYGEDEAVLASYASTVQKQQVTVEHEKDDYIKIQCTNENEERKALLLTIPLDDGWQITVDGQQVTAEAAIGNLMLLQVEPGEHLIELRFLPQGFLFGTAISVGAVLVLLTIYVGKRIRKTKKENDEE